MKTRRSLSVTFRNAIRGALCSLTLALLMSAAPSQAGATEVGNGRNIGLGFQLGSPSGLVGKYFLGGGNALDFGISFYRYGGNGCWNGKHWVGCDGRSNFGSTGFHMDYLWQDNIARGSANLDWHIGGGARMWWWHGDSRINNSDDFALAARMPIGIDLTFNRPDFIEVFFEIAPTLFVVPIAYFDFEGALGVRFYF